VSARAGTYMPIVKKAPHEVSKQRRGDCQAFGK
jgi:hypothetical protein